MAEVHESRSWILDCEIFISHGGLWMVHFFGDGCGFRGVFHARLFGLRCELKREDMGTSIYHTAAVHPPNCTQSDHKANQLNWTMTSMFFCADHNHATWLIMKYHEIMIIPFIKTFMIRQPPAVWCRCQCRSTATKRTMTCGTSAPRDECGTTIGKNGDVSQCFFVFFWWDLNEVLVFHGICKPCCSCLEMP